VDKSFIKKNKPEFKRNVQKLHQLVATFVKPNEPAADRLTEDVCIEPSGIEKLKSSKQFHFFH
jgi:hypothetical protein